LLMNLPLRLVIRKLFALTWNCFALPVHTPQSCAAALSDRGFR
jgi:hypothetical protein